ncbi:MAG: hypothetical protein V5B60_07700 [Accumulibacter sp.]|jgi:hypothetical protein|uniref:hypothetical protein n=1 Tax=Accumulibacter sp. TaxID=2053492 RepID=UPI002FC27998
MARVIDRGWAKPDDPIYKSGPMVSFRQPSPALTSATPETTAGASQSSAPGEELPDPMQPAIDAIEEMGRKDFGDRYNPKA